MKSKSLSRIPRGQRLIAVLWPSFGVAIAASGLFFSAFDPASLHPFDADFDAGPLAIYSIGFLLFWLLGALAGYGTLYFLVTNDQVLRREGKQPDVG